MDATMIDEHLENIDRRLTRLEQILPTLATKDELTTLATKEELSAAAALLATKEELNAAVALLATKEELRAAVAPLATRDDIHQLRRHMEVLIEDQRSDTRLLAEHLAVVMSRLPDR
jgi:adenine C2-methylase RlmN of 23S rRNA A2503 and tRNA A37